MSNLSPEKRLIFLLSRVKPSPDTIRAAKDILKSTSQAVDYGAVVKLASKNGVSPLLYHNLKKFAFVPENIMNRLKNDYLFTVKKNTLNSRELIGIITLLKKGGVTAIPLKGAVASDLIFGDPGLYPSGDLDILVRPSNLGKTREILFAEGYKKASESEERDMLLSSYHINFQRGNNFLEVHWNLTFRYFDVSPDFWWEETIKREYEGTEIMLLSPERYLLYTVFRFYSHAFRPLRFGVLIAEIIHKHQKEMGWERLLGFSERYRMGRLVLFTLKLLHDLLGAAVPEEILSRRVHGYGFLKGAVLSGLFHEVKKIHLRMLLFTALQQTPMDTAKVLLRRISPPASEVRLRYGLSGESRKVYLYYLLNPLLMLIRKKG